MTPPGTNQTKTTRIAGRPAVSALLGVLLGFGAAHPASSQTLCNFTLPPPPGNSAQINFSTPWMIYGDTSSANNPGYGAIQVGAGNSAISPGVYATWCVDEITPIWQGPTDYDVLLASSYDPNLNQWLPQDRTSTVYVGPEVWHQVNYLLNHKQGANFWNVQAAIWTLVGGPPPPDYLDGYGIFTPASLDEINGLVADAQANAASWQLPCGGTIGVVVSVQNWYVPVQILLMEVPCKCTASITPPSATICQAGSQTFQADPPGGTTDYTVSWTGPEGFTAQTASITVSVPGTYYATITDSAGHIYGGTATLTVTPPGSISVQKTVSSPDDLDGIANNNIALLPDDGLLHAVTFGVTVTNPGPADLVNVTLSDPALVNLGCALPAPFPLRANQSRTLTLCTIPLGCQDSVSDCVNPWLGQAMGCTVFQLGGGKVSVTGPAGGVVGNVCIGPKGTLEMSGDQYVAGQVRLAADAIFKPSGSTSVGQAVSGVDLTGEAADARNAAAWAAALPVTQTFGKLNKAVTILGNGGVNVIALGSIELDGGKVLTLQGTAADQFILNVSGRLALTGGAKILVAGGALRKNVLLNITGKDDVSLNGGGGGANCCNSVVEGTILAINSKINLSPGLVNGEVISGKDISLSSGSSVRCLSTPPPVLLNSAVTVTAMFDPAMVGACAFDLKGNPITVQSEASAQVGCKAWAPPQPARPACPCSLGYPFVSGNPLTSTVFNESEVLRAFSPDIAVAGDTIKAWYSDEHALLLGVRRVIVKTAQGSKTNDFPLTPLSSNPGSALNPAFGTTATSGDLAGIDPVGRPIFPALFVTDITGNPASRAGDWQYGGTPIPPHAVFGTWKSTVQTVDKTKTPAVVTQTVDADPAKNNWSLANGDAAPAGTVNGGYGAEVRWSVDALGLTPGHTYRLQFMVHDGDQNKTGGDVGEACAILSYGTTTSPCAGQ